MRVLLDTNTIVAGFISPHGPPAALLLGWLERDLFELITSRAQLDELARVLEYDRIKARVRPDRAADFVANVDAKAVLVEPGEVKPWASDPDDNVILAAAVAGGADLIVSGDKKHVQPLGDVEGIPIVTPAEALERLTGKAGGGEPGSSA